ncbi:amylo-alpha-1,6-glucosidase [Rhabdothermincola sp.]|uniref:amylo-alpha-1,6-glucosidase n=1 Tax=Rhabdothermincola sp. TaxID=2820405 RepID=UPI002FE21F0B
MPTTEPHPAALQPGPGGSTSPSPWAPAGPVASLVTDTGLVTLVEGSSFCVSGRSGDMLADLPHGLFVLDTRCLSRWELTVDGHPLEPLTVASDAPFEATFVSRVHPGRHQADSELLVFRRRHVGHGMRERLTIHNFGTSPARIDLAIELDIDFADVFEVKESRVCRRESYSITCTPTEWRSVHEAEELTKTVTLHLSRAAVTEPSRLSWTLDVPARGQSELCLELDLAVGDHLIEPRFRCGQPDEHAEPTRRHTAWRAGTPVLKTDHPALARAVTRAMEDLGALRIFDPEHPELPVTAAGAPWFMTLFGRDSLITGWMALLFEPSLALGVLQTLARLQGTRVDDATEEEPGRILHEVRFEKAASLALGGGAAYYGTADATALFVMLAGELRRWGVATDVIDGLVPHLDHALAWIEDWGDRDGDGYVEYQRRNPSGLVNQGWKDSWDGVNHADGRIAAPPIALCEVQGYVYAAYRARAHLAAEVGDLATAERYDSKAATLKEAFNRDFWLDDRGWFAIGLDATKEPIDALSSNIGHCLWTGIVDEDKATQVADHLLSPEMFTGWGIRTLASSMARYNPISYHNGSVWPHDTAICAAGLMRYGFVDHATTVIEGLLEVAHVLGGRLPELFAGLDRRELSVPAAYPTSCSPQAWAAASPLLLLRTMLRLDPSAHRQQVHLAPVMPQGMTRLELHGIRIGDRTLDIRWERGDVTVDGLGGLELLATPRPPVHDS